MSLFSKLFGLKTECPLCWTPGAKDGFWGVKCVSEKCSNYDEAYAKRVTTPARKLARRRSAQRPADFSTPVLVGYTNFKGEKKTFVADPESMRIRNAHLSLRVAPSGMRITLKREKIHNLDFVEGILRQREERPQQPGRPTPHEQYIIDFHEQRGTTSPLHESLRRKYPKTGL